MNAKIYYVTIITYVYVLFTYEFHLLPTAILTPVMALLVAANAFFCSHVVVSYYRANKFHALEVLFYGIMILSTFLLQITEILPVDAVTRFVMYMTSVVMLVFGAPAAILIYNRADADKEEEFIQQKACL